MGNTLGFFPQTSPKSQSRALALSTVKLNEFQEKYIINQPKTSYKKTTIHILKRINNIIEEEKLYSRKITRKQKLRKTKY